MVAQANEAEEVVLVDMTIPETPDHSKPSDTDDRLDKADDDDVKPAPLSHEKPTSPAAESEVEPDHPATYAEAVKVHTREKTIPEEQEPTSPSSSKPSPVSKDEAANEDDEEESSTLLDKSGTPKVNASAAQPSPTSAKDLQYLSEEAETQIPSTRRPAETPTRERPTSFPFPRSVSHNSNLASPQSGSSTPSRSPSHQNLSESISNSSTGHGTPSGPEDKGGKTRKRLSSLKGFVRRISDQGSGLVRSNSTGRPGSRSGGLASPEAGTGAGSPGPGDGIGKKRLPLNRGNSQQ